MLNRYLPLLFAVYGNPFYDFSTNLTSCEAEQIFSILFESLQYLPWAAFSALRTYALQRSRPWAILIFAFSLSPLIINLVAKHWQIVYEDLVEGCVIANTIPTNLQRACMCQAATHGIENLLTSHAVAILARLPLVLADIAIIVITWTTQYTDHKLASTLRGNLNLATVLLRDGTAYFLILTAINVAQMVTGVLSVSHSM
ncbi:hypothetical protein FKP32DRAFT_1020950 [Trametes sanguinea]|nr:hypothetical protein FKP32DRAFT_1020950 [Trametes sanguinea]